MFGEHLNIEPGSAVRRIRSRRVVFCEEIEIDGGGSVSVSDSEECDRHYSRYVHRRLGSGDDARKVLMRFRAIDATVVIVEGKIRRIIEHQDEGEIDNEQDVIDFGDAWVLPGLVDFGSHLCCPGEEMDEKRVSAATRLAASGGVTTLIASPLCTYTPALSVENLRNNIRCAEAAALQNGLYCDLGLLGLASPHGCDDAIDLVRSGAIGLSLYMSHVPFPLSEVKSTHFSDAAEVAEYFAAASAADNAACFEDALPLLVHHESYTPIELGRASPFRCAPYEHRSKMARRGLMAGNSWYMEEDENEGVDVGLRRSWQRCKKKASDAMVRAMLFSERKSYTYDKANSPKRAERKLGAVEGSPLSRRRKLKIPSVDTESKANENNVSTDNFNAKLKTSYRVFETLRPVTHELRGVDIFFEGVC